MRKKTRRRAGLLCLAWLLLTAPNAAAVGDDCALTLRYPCGGASFRLYRVGTANLEGNYALTGDFASYSVSLTNLDAQGWAGAAETLDGYAARDDLEPLKTAATDESGALTFSQLPPGLYLVTGPRYTTGGEVYTPQPFLTLLPGATGDSAVTVTPKYEKTTAPSSSGGWGREEDSDTVDFWVYLRWADESDGFLAPGSVTVQLLRDGAVYDEVTLSDANGWRYRWSGLDSRYTWRVVQKDVPEGYTVTVAQDGTTVLLTNTPAMPRTTRDPAVTEEPSASPHPASPAPDAAPPEPSSAPAAPADPGTVAVPSGPAGEVGSEAVSEADKTENAAGGGKIPQTGQLWWPVPLLTLAGLGLYLLGWWRARRDDHEG